jgi:hypothetical protein
MNRAQESDCFRYRRHHCCFEYWLKLSAAQEDRNKTLCWFVRIESWTSLWRSLRAMVIKVRKGVTIIIIDDAEAGLGGCT